MNSSNKLNLALEQMYSADCNFISDVLKKYFIFDKIFNLLDYDNDMSMLYEDLKKLKAEKYIALKKIQNNVDFEIKKIKDCEGEDNISKIIKDNFYENKLSSSETSCICVGSSEVCEESIITCSNLNIKITVQNI
jgi:hypothetical protein